MATVPTNAPFILYSGNIDTFPLSTALTGTVTAPDIEVVGVGTLFLSECGGGNTNDLSIPIQKQGLGYLFNGTTEYRKIVSVLSDNLLYIESPFTVALAGASVKRIPESRTMSIGWVDATATSIGGGVVNGVTLVGGEYEEANVHEFTNRPIRPIIVNSLSGNVHVLVSYS